MLKLLPRLFILAVVSQQFVQPAHAQHFLPPGDVVLRHDLALLGDAGIFAAPLTAWPLSSADARAAITVVSPDNLTSEQLLAYYRVKDRLSDEGSVSQVSLGVSGAVEPLQIRTFEDTPRAEAGITARWSRYGKLFDIVLDAGVVANPSDGRHGRPDGSYLSAKLGNWLLSGGWQRRWWGPGHNSSLILSTNARPLPALSLQRARSHAFESPWLSWLGPWSITSFAGVMDDDREVRDTLLVGLRLTARPLPGLELGLSRTAQWCGENRPCDGGSFIDLLLGRDNRGVNVAAEDEPGNQLAGFDFRWRLPIAKPVSLYAQWIAEDTRRGGPELGSWMKLAGLEWSGRLGGYQSRNFFEFADTSCRRGGLGFSGIAADCAYEHGIYKSGYRYLGRSVGHSVDSDGIAYSAGSTLVQSDGLRWTILLRYAELNRVGNTTVPHSLSRTPVEHADILVSHGRDTAAGSLNVGIGGQLSQSAQGGGNNKQVVLFFEWRSNQQR